VITNSCARSVSKRVLSSNVSLADKQSIPNANDVPTRSRSSRPPYLQASRLNSNHIVLTGLSGLAWPPLPPISPSKKLLHVTCYLLRSFPSYQHSLFGSDDLPEIVSKTDHHFEKGITVESRLQSPRILAFAYSCLHVTGQRHQSSHRSLFFTHRCLISGEPRSMYGSNSRGDCRRVRAPIGHCSALGNRE